jgi:RIO-like serine/threonine protein kinase
MATVTCLKRGTCGDVVLDTASGEPRIVRDQRQARYGFRWLARHLARREAKALAWLGEADGFPVLIALERDRLTRSFVAGQPMHIAEPRSPTYYRNALRLLRNLHRERIVHNDLAKEANWICRSHDRAAIIDFQLAACCSKRGFWFRLLAREDLRHLLKHKARYCPERLTARQRAILARPSLPSRCWRVLFKPPYHFLTRRLLGWPERHSAVERERPI